MFTCHTTKSEATEKKIIAQQPNSKEGLHPRESMKSTARMQLHLFTMTIIVGHKSIYCIHFEHYLWKSNPFFD